MLKRTSVFLLTLVGTGILSACGSNTPAGPGGGGSNQIVISITGMDGPQAFNPTVATITAAQTVAWRNDDTKTHRPILSGIIDTKQLAPGATSAATTITRGPGTYDYKCTIHPSEYGQVVVTP
jgi:plastocyanin